MHDQELEQVVTLAKSADATSKPRSFWWSEIRKHANRIRKSGQSIQSATAFFITKDADGVELFKAYNAAKPGVLAADDGPGETRGVHLKALEEVAAAIQKKYPEQHLTKSAAIALAIQTPLGAQHYLADKRARGIA